jgi:hypothetical protein
MRILSFIFVITVVIINSAAAQSVHSWFNSELNIKPFTANFYEPKAGTSFDLNGKFLRLDIGTTQDVYSIQDSITSYSFGADLFTYTRLRSENDFKFPVETIDYFFGVNFGFKHFISDGNYGLRFRLSHVSAHLVDGLYDGQKNDWRNGLSPFVFSKEFIELFPFYQLENLRVYLGMTYIFHVIPETIGKGIYQFGFDYHLTQLSFVDFTPFIAVDYKLSSAGDFNSNIISTIGFKFGKVFGKGFSLMFTYYDGKSVHSEFFNRDESYSTIGFNVDL